MKGVLLAEQDVPDQSPLFRKVVLQSVEIILLIDFGFGLRYTCSMLQKHDLRRILNCFQHNITGGIRSKATNANTIHAL